jgi:hypothetical protein
MIVDTNICPTSDMIACMNNAPVAAPDDRRPAALVQL